MHFNFNVFSSSSAIAELGGLVGGSLLGSDPWADCLEILVGAPARRGVPAVALGSSPVWRVFEPF